jgi:hypothetical protein
MASFNMLTPAKEAELKENLWQIAKLEKAVQQVIPHPISYTLHPGKVGEGVQQGEVEAIRPCSCCDAPLPPAVRGLNTQPSALLPPAVRERWPAVDDTGGRRS